MLSTRILLVEDDDDDYLLTLECLEGIETFNLEVTRAKNAHEALKHLCNNDFDLCLLDYQLGAVDGIEVLCKTTELAIATPVIMLTGQADDVLDKRALDAGAVDYLIKSEINSARFARSIRYALARREVEQERIERLKAESESTSKSRFLAHLSHELRTPLTAILGYAELLLNDPEHNKAHNELEIILRNGRHLLDLLNDVLDLSKISANKLELNICKVNLEALLADVSSLLHASASDKGLSLQMKALTRIPVEIETDPTRLRQILINLINNAIKFTSTGGVKVFIRSVSTKRGTQLAFDVEDTGIGVPEDKLESVFRPFSQVGDMMTKSLGGSGLGLAISSELANRLGGEISLKSTLGEGSCFSATVNAGDVDRVQWANLEFKTKPISHRRTPEKYLRGKVLVVDDVRDIRRLISLLVRSTGATVEHASNGLQAIESIVRAKALGQPFELVLMDVHMAELNGIDATRKIRALKHDVPIFALTAAIMKGSKERLLGHGFSGLLAKPIDTGDLMELLSAQLERSQQRPRDPLLAVSGNKKTLRSKDRASETEAKLAILLIEDDRDAAGAMAELLSSLGSVVTLAHTAAQAKALLDSQLWEAILIDLHLPDVYGTELIEHIHRQYGFSNAHQNGATLKKRRPFMAVISGDLSAGQLTSNYPINDILVKPIQLAKLSALISKAYNFKASQL